MKPDGKIYIGIIIGMLLITMVLTAGAQAQEEGLVGEWHFDEGAGNIVKDSSGNGNDGVIHGATWVEGKFGKALRFDGKDDYVEVQSSAGASLDIGSTTSKLTLEAWIYLKNYYSEGRKIVGKAYAYYIQVYGSTPSYDKLWFETANAGGWWNAGVTIPLNEWVHVVATYDGAYKKVYVNGVEMASIPQTGIIASNSNSVKIGLPTSDTFNGFIDEVRIYNRALTPEEIKTHYEQGPSVLSLTKTASPNPIKQSQTTTVTLTIKNTGASEITDIEIADPVPSDLTLISGETSKTYASLRPGDSREFQYVVQIDEAGTFNLDPATATYADEKGNYHTVKSKPVAIEVIPSLVKSPIKTPEPTDSNVGTASVNLHGEKTNVTLGEDVLLKLSAVNI